MSRPLKMFVATLAGQKLIRPVVRPTYKCANSRLGAPQSVNIHVRITFNAILAHRQGRLQPRARFLGAPKKY